MAGQLVGCKGSKAFAHGFDEADPDHVLGRHEVDQPVTDGCIGGQCLTQELLDVEHLGSAFAHPGYELVVLPLRSLDP